MNLLPRANTVVVLSVSPIDADHIFLEDVLNNSNCTLCPDSKWTLYRSRTFASALNILSKSIIPIVVYECDSIPGRWKEMLAQLALLTNPPFLILTSRLADEYLWAEALNLGAYDVLVKPFDSKEVGRICCLAWLHWEDRTSRPGRVERQ